MVEKYAELTRTAGDVFDLFTKKKIEPKEQDTSPPKQNPLDPNYTSPFLEMAKKYQEGGMSAVKHEFETGSIIKKLNQLRKVTQDCYSPTTLKSNIELVDSYDDEQLRQFVFKTDESNWLTKPTFFRAVLLVAMKRWMNK